MAWGSTLSKKAQRKIHRGAKKARRSSRQNKRAAKRVSRSIGVVGRSVTPQPLPKSVQRSIRSFEREIRNLRLTARATNTGVSLPKGGLSGIGASQIPRVRAQVRNAESAIEAKQNFDQAMAAMSATIAAGNPERPGILQRGPGGSLLYELGIVDDEDLAAGREALYGTENLSDLAAMAQFAPFGVLSRVKRGGEAVGGALRGADEAEDIVDLAEAARLAKTGEASIGQKAGAWWNTMGRGGGFKRTPVRDQARWLRDYRRARKGKTPLGPRAPTPRKYRTMEEGFATRGLALGGTAAGAVGLAVASQEETRNVAKSAGAAAAATATPEGMYSSAKSALYGLLGAVPAAKEFIEASGALAGGNSAPMEELAQEMADYYEEFYTPWLEGDTDKVYETVKEETGITPVALDAMIFGAPAGNLLGKAARGGMLGQGLQTAATRARPRIMTEAGIEAGPVNQPLSNNPFTVGAQRTMDRARTRRTSTRAAKGDALNVEAERQGAVTPLRERNVTRGMNTREGRRRERWRLDKTQIVHQGILKDAHELLTPLQRDIGIKMVMALGTPTNPKDARRVISQRRKQIARERDRDIRDELNRRGSEYGGEEFQDMSIRDIDELREADPGGDTELGGLLMAVERDVNPPELWDELKTMDTLDADAEKIFTPELQEFVDRQNPVMRALGYLDPSIPDDRVRAREVAAQVAFMKGNLEMQAEELDAVVTQMPDGDHRKFLLEEVSAGLKQRAANLDRRDVDPGTEPIPDDVRRASAKALQRKERKRGRYVGDTELTIDDILAAFPDRFKEFGDLESNAQRNEMVISSMRPREIYEIALAKARAEFGDDVRRVNMSKHGVNKPPTLIPNYAQLQTPRIYPYVNKPIKITAYKDVPNRTSPSRAARRADQEEYDPAPEAISERTFYQGAVATSDADLDLAPEDLDPLKTNTLNAFGPGIYTTSKPGIARGYAGLGREAPRWSEAQAEGNTPVIRTVRFDAREGRVLDLEADFDMDSPLYDSLMNVALKMDAEPTPEDPYAGFGDDDDFGGGDEPNFDDEDTSMVGLVEEMVDDPDVTGTRAYMKFIQEVAYVIRSNQGGVLDAVKLIEEVSVGLREAGIDVLTHKGGALTGHRPHQVVIALDPENVYDVDDPGYEGNPITEFERRGYRQGAEARLGEAGIIENQRDAELPLDRIPEQTQTLGNGVGLEPEPIVDYLARVEYERLAQGLNKAGYFPSRFPRTSNYAAFALGGRKAMARAKRWKGELQRRGIEDPSVAVLMAGAAENIKRFHNWNLMTDSVDRLAFKWSRGENGEGMSVAEILEEAGHRGVSEDSFTLVNAGIFRKNLEGADPDRPASFLDDTEGNDPIVGKILANAFADPPVMRANPDAYGATSGWVALPKRHADEILSSYKTSAGGRVLDILTTQQSRLLLATLNIPWLQFQVMSNAMLTGLVAGVGPVAMLQARKWWRQLPEEQKRAIAPYIGNGHFTLDARKPMMGSKANNEFVNSWRAFKETIGGKVIWKGGDRTPLVTSQALNPLNVMFAMDNAQNNFFRTAIFYKEVKKDAWNRMGENTSKLGQIQDRLMGFFQLDPEQQMRSLLDNKGILETHAQTVADWLGDYNRFSAAERNWLKRNVMFYGFLRFSLRLAFYTLPTKHPVMAGLLYQLGRLKVEEVIELLGGDELPYALGRIYNEDGSTMLDLQRANPLMNALNTNLLRGDPIGAMGFFPPMYGMLAAQVFKVDPFTGKALTVDGETTSRAALDLGVENRLEIAARQGLRLYYPYRIYEEFTQQGRPVTSDSISLPGPEGFADPNYKAYVDEEVVEGINKNSERFSDAYPTLGDFLLTELNPFGWKESTDIAIARNLRAREREEKRRLGLSGRPPVPASGNPSFGSGFSSSGGFGGSGFGQ